MSDYHIGFFYLICEAGKREATAYYCCSWVMAGRLIVIPAAATAPRTGGPKRRVGGITVTMRQRKPAPLQKGRYLSIEAIQAVQALKRAHSSGPLALAQALRGGSFTRLLKLDMVAVLRELLRQNHCLPSLKVFENMRKEDWYKPRVSLYSEMIGTMAANGCKEEAELIFGYLQSEAKYLEEKDEGEGFAVLLGTLIRHELTAMAMECYGMMKALGCEPDRSTFRMLIHGFTLLGEPDAAAAVRLDAHQCYPLFLEEDDQQD